MVEAIRNPTPEQVRDMIRASRHQAVRRIIDPRNGDVWCWPAEQGSHAQGAAFLGVPYDPPPNGGDILTLDE